MTMTTKRTGATYTWELWHAAELFWGLNYKSFLPFRQTYLCSQSQSMLILLSLWKPNHRAHALLLSSFLDLATFSKFDLIMAKEGKVGSRGKKRSSKKADFESKHVIWVLAVGEFIIGLEQ